MKGDQKFREFKEDLWKLIMEYAPTESNSSDKFMVAGALLSTTLEVHVLILGRDSTAQVIEDAIDSIRYEDYKRKLH